MTIKLAILKSGEDVIADIKELVSEEDNKVLSYVFKNPYAVKLLTPQVLTEEVKDREYSVSFFPWVPLSSDTEIFVNTDWVVSIVEPTEGVKKSYEEKMNGRDGFGDGRTDSGPRDGGDSGDRTRDSSSSINESIEFDQ
jgi:hypothetical protein